MAAAVAASLVLGERENESGEQPGARGGSGSFKSRPRSGRRAHDARGAGAVRRRLGLTGRGRRMKGAALTAGPDGQRLGWHGEGRAAAVTRELGWRVAGDAGPARSPGRAGHCGAQRRNGAGLAGWASRPELRERSE